MTTPAKSEVPAPADETPQARVTLVKVGPTIPEGQADDSKQDPFSQGSVIEPRFHPDELLKMYEEADSLRPNIDTLAHNVAGMGWKLKPRIDFSKETAKNEVAAALYLADLERFKREIVTAEDRGSVRPPAFPEDDVAAETTKRWEQEARMERIEIEVWLEALCLECPLSELIRRTLVDRESVGWGAWEVIRNKIGRICRLKQVEARTLRLGPLDQKPTTHIVMRPTSKVSYAPTKVEETFRRLVQFVGAELRWFRQFGDPRIISSKNGAVFPDVEALKGQDENAEPANELWWFPNHYPDDPYGVIKWHGMIPGIKGSRIAQDNTVVDLDSSSIPRGLLLAMDTRLGNDVTAQLKQFFGANRGKAHNRIAIIEAATAKTAGLSGTGRMQLEWVSLAEAQLKDAAFMDYVERVMRVVGQQFRIPKILVGAMEDFNRSTSIAAMEYAEEQVFQPERLLLEWDITHKLLVSRGVRFWAFALKGPTKADRESFSKALDVGLKHGSVTPQESRPVFERLLGIDLPESAGDWQNQPIALTLAGVPLQGQAVMMSQGGAPARRMMLIQNVDDAQARELAEYLGADLHDRGSRLLMDGSMASELVSGEDGGDEP